MTPLALERLAQRTRRRMRRDKPHHTRRATRRLDIIARDRLDS